MIDTPLASRLERPVLYFPELGALYGPCGALLIQQIDYWCRHNVGNVKSYHKGKHWCFRTYKQWADDLGCFSESTVKRTLYSLAKAGVVETDRFNPKKYDKTNWYRVNKKVLYAALSATGQNEQSEEVESLVKLTSTTGQPDTIHQVTLTQPIQEIKEEITEEILASLKTPEESGMKKVTSSKAILEMYSSKPKVQTTADSVQSMELMWKQVVPEAHPTVKFIPSFTMAQKGQLGKMRKVWVDATDQTLRTVLEKWVAFTEFVTAQTGLKSTPDVPHVGFLLKYVGEARSFVLSVQLIAPGKKEPSLPKVLKSQTTVPDPVQGVVKIGGVTIVKKAKPAPEIPKETAVTTSTGNGEDEASLEEILQWKKPK